MFVNKIAATLGAVSMTALVLAGGAASAESYRYATGFPAGSTGTLAHEAFAEKVKELSGGDIKVKVYPQSLLSFPEMSAGIRDGVADMGFVVPVYTPAEYPSTVMMGEMTMMWSQFPSDARGGMAWAGAFMEYIMLNCPDCMAENKAQNQLFTANGAATYSLMCTKEIHTADDLQGLGIRTPGAHWARWATAFGARSVSLPTSESFEGLTQGILDCTISGNVELVDLSLNDAVKHVSLSFPGGGFGDAAQGNINLDVWKGMSEDTRTIMLKGAAHQSAELSWGYRENGAAAVEVSKGKGVSFKPISDELLAATQAFTLEDLKGVAAKYTEKGLSGTDARVEKMVELFTKWAGLVEGVSTSDELGDLYWQEIHSKIDVSSYGL